jgi:oligogalacturonide transport system permease protein
MSGESRYLGFWYVAPYVLGLALFKAFPFVASFYLSFTDYDLLSSPEWVGIENYERLFTRDRTFQKSLEVTLLSTSS